MKEPRYIKIESGGYEGSSGYAQHLNSALGDYFRTPPNELERIVVGSHEAHQPFYLSIKNTSLLIISLVLRESLSECVVYFRLDQRQLIAYCLILKMLLDLVLLADNA